MIKFRLFGLGNERNAATPEKTEQPAQGAVAPTEATQACRNGKRVLIVDDDAVFVKATSMKLNSAGFDVATARDGSEAISNLAENPAQAILMDITFAADVCNGGMGSWDGFQIMSWLRGLPASKGARFIVVSNSDTDAYRKRAQSLGAVAYFQKPLDFERLIAIVNAEN